MPPLETRDRDPHWGRMSKSSAELEAMKEAAAEKVRATYDATTRAIANGVAGLAGERDAPVDKFKAGMAAEMQKATPPAPVAPAAKAVSPQPPTDDARLLLDLVAQAEVKGHPVRYDVTFGFGKYAPRGASKPVTALTLDEIDAYQAGMLAQGSISTAVRKYQINRDTLRDLRRQLQLDGSEVFTPELQEKLGRKRLSQTGYDGYLAGDLSEEVFRRKLNGAWASVPLPGDRSRYKQPLGTTDAAVREVLENIRSGRPGSTVLGPR